MNIWAFHGFLGQNTDWDQWKVRFNQPNLKAWNLDQYVEEKSYPSKKKFIDDLGPLIRRDKPLIIGYSMGGRIALELGFNYQQNVKGLILLSANYGLFMKADKPKRRMIDENWAARFVSEPWEKVVEEWNSQPVFSADEDKAYPKENYKTESLTYWLTEWSLGNQGNFFELLSDGELPWLSIYGEKDSKFRSLWGRLKPLETAKTKSFEVPETGHRVLDKIDRIPPELVQNFVNMC